MNESSLSTRQILIFINIVRVSPLFIQETGQSLAVATSSLQTQTKPCRKSQTHTYTHFPLKVDHDKRVFVCINRWSVPVLALESVGVEPVELERGGIFVLLLLFAFGFFSILRPNSGERASELFSIKRGEQRVGVSAGQATKALIHFCQTRRPHYGDILTTNKPKEKQRHNPNVSVKKKLCANTKKKQVPKKRGLAPWKAQFFLGVGSVAPHKALAALQKRKTDK